MGNQVQGKIKEDSKVMMEEKIVQECKNEKVEHAFIEKVTSGADLLITTEIKPKVDTTHEMIKVPKPAKPKSGNQDKNMSCNRCEKKFSSIYNLKQNKTQHTGDEPFNCSQCNFSSKHHWVLNRHAQRVQNF